MVLVKWTAALLRETLLWEAPRQSYYSSSLLELLELLELLLLLGLVASLHRSPRATIPRPTSYRSGRSAQMSSVCVPMEPVDPSSEILRCVYLVWGRCVCKRWDRSIEPSIDRFGYSSPTAAAFMLLGAPQCLRDAPTHLLVLSKCQVGRLLERLDRVHCRGGKGSGAGQLQIS